MSDNDSEFSSSDDRQYPLSPSMSIEDEINRFLPPQTPTSESSDKFSDAAPSGAGVVPVWNFGEDEDASNEGNASLSMIPESYQMSSSTLSDLSMATRALKEAVAVPGVSNGETSSPSKDADGETEGEKPKFVEVACQTIATGDIIATQLYQQTNKV